MFTDDQDIALWSMPRLSESAYNAQGMPAMLADTMAYQTIYPEIYFRVMPFIMMACDEMDAFGCATPTHDMVYEMSDRIYQDVGRIHPDLAGVQSSQIGLGGGFFNDLITIMLLNEFFNRRRRRY